MTMNTFPRFIFICHFCTSWRPFVCILKIPNWVSTQPPWVPNFPHILLSLFAMISISFWLISSHGRLVPFVSPGARLKQAHVTYMDCGSPTYILQTSQIHFSTFSLCMVASRKYTLSSSMSLIIWSQFCLALRFPSQIFFASTLKKVTWTFFVLMSASLCSDLTNFTVSSLWSYNSQMKSQRMSMCFVHWPTCWFLTK
jgi:hypothetical protein